MNRFFRVVVLLMAGSFSLTSFAQGSSCSANSSDLSQCVAEIKAMQQQLYQTFVNNFASISQLPGSSGNTPPPPLSGGSTNQPTGNQPVSSTTQPAPTSSPTPTGQNQNGGDVSGFSNENNKGDWNYEY